MVRTTENAKRCPPPFISVKISLSRRLLTRYTFVSRAFDTYTRTHARARLQARDERQQADECRRRGERINRRGQFLLRLQRKSSLTARRASLILGPRTSLAVIHVPAPLAHPQLTVNQVRLALFGFHKLGRRSLLRRSAESALRPRSRRSRSRWLLIKERARLRLAARLRALWNTTRKTHAKHHRQSHGMTSRVFTASDSRARDAVAQPSRARDARDVTYHRRCAHGERVRGRSRGKHRES